MGWSCPWTEASRPSENAPKSMRVPGTLQRRRSRPDHSGQPLNTNRKDDMSYAIIGFGAVGQALARAFARKNIEVVVASRRPPQALASQAQAIGSTVVPRTLQEAIKEDMIFLAVPFWEHR